jgi:hypothetical protein
MKKRLIPGHFSSIPTATLITSTLDIDPEDEVQDDAAPAGEAPELK